MSRIATLTLNPALDKNLRVARLVPQIKMSCEVQGTDAGGGGINVSRVLHRFGTQAFTLYLAGGDQGRQLHELLLDEHVNSMPVPILGQTRENLIVVDRSTHLQYRLNMPGPQVERSEWLGLLDRLTALGPLDWVVASGSLSPGIPIHIYALLADLSRDRGFRLVVDTKGDALKTALEKGVYLVKPNLMEFCNLFSEEETYQERWLIAKARKLIHEGKCHIVVISLGPLGALLVTAEEGRRIPAPVVKQQSSVGAGDSMMAGLIYMLDQGKSPLEAAQFGVACGTASTLNPGTELCVPAEAQRLYENIRTQQYC